MNQGAKENNNNTLAARQQHRLSPFSLVNFCSPHFTAGKIMSEDDSSTLLGSTTNERKDSDKWLNAFSDPLAGLYTFGCCMTLADLQGDGDHKLIIADLGTGKYNMTLKVYKGNIIHLYRVFPKYTAHWR